MLQPIETIVKKIMISANHSYNELQRLKFKQKELSKYLKVGLFVIGENDQKIMQIYEEDIENFLWMVTKSGGMFSLDVRALDS